jgi:HEAT repeat protein
MHPNFQGVGRACGLILAALLTWGCAGTQKSRGKDSEPESSVDRFVPIQSEGPESIGVLLQQLDLQTERWSHLVMTGQSAEEKRLARAIELQLESATKKRQTDLVAQLESGPPLNRVRAAGVLGFTRSAEVQSPLLNALSDREPDVVHNALLSLAILDLGDTPLEEIAELAGHHPEPATRTNAMYALRCILERRLESEPTARSEVSLRVARTGLVDSDPLVRAQAVLVLGLLGDDDSTLALVDRLSDSAAHVRFAAVEAMVLLGQRSPSGKGDAARGLVQGLVKVDKGLRPAVHRGLVRLAELDHGSDPEAWARWAAKLP